MLKVRMRFIRETKNAIRYQEIRPDGSVVEEYSEPNCCIGAIYIRKSSLEMPAPPMIQVDITVAKGSKK